MYGDQLRYLPLVDLIIMIHLLIMQLEKYGFIYLDINLMCFKLLRNGNAWLKNETGKILKCLRSDNDGDYYSHEFEDYYSTNGFHGYKIVPKTP